MQLQARKATWQPHADLCQIPLVRYVAGVRNTVRCAASVRSQSAVPHDSKTPQSFTIMIHSSLPKYFWSARPRKEQYDTRSYR